MSTIIPSMTILTTTITKVNISAAASANAGTIIPKAE